MKKGRYRKEGERSVEEGRWRTVKEGG